MPNIELHGFFRQYAETELFQKITKLLKGFRGVSQVVVTFCDTCVINLKDMEQSHIRVVATPGKDRDRLVKKLEALGEDIEVLDLAQWVPSKKKKK
ncbi:MAG: hypothetical protein RLZZ76_242 [Candidatus Parcubacteria bacterium]|jgi:hypothetical protein